MRLYIQSTQSHPQPVGLNYSMCIVTLNIHFPVFILNKYAQPCTVALQQLWHKPLLHILWILNLQLRVGKSGRWMFVGGCFDVHGHEEQHVIVLACALQKKSSLHLWNTGLNITSLGAQSWHLLLSLFFFMWSFSREKAPSLGLYTLHKTGCSWQKNK